VLVEHKVFDSEYIIGVQQVIDVDGSQESEYFEPDIGTKAPKRPCAYGFYVQCVGQLGYCSFYPPPFIENKFVQFDGLRILGVAPVGNEYLCEGQFYADIAFVA